ncbi:MAG: hypothetical protein MUC87_17780 [Bacteroidia bacterium]|jgi:hypothetical protein|nr:hypothetical protein [Bacteroidia bacterium]
MKRFGRFLLWLGLGLSLVAVILWFTPLRRVVISSPVKSFTEAEYRNACDSLRKKARTGGDEARKKILRKAISHDIFQYWEGTKWSFYGTTEVPGKGKIACGYFVTTVLRDCGVPLQRATLAQQASEQIIKKLVAEKNIRRFSKVQLGEFVKAIKAKGNHAYVVGLDTHVGFLVCENGEVNFVHSSGGYPWAVVKERAEESAVLNQSKYRVTGCLTADEGFMQRWEKALQ